MIGALEFQIDGTFVGLPKRAQARVYTETHLVAGKFWDRRYLRLHFMASAGARYGYQHRTAQTKARKKALAEQGKVQKGGTVDLVHSGLLERSMVRMHAVSATPRQVKIPMPSTSYVSMRPKGSRVHMAKEILAVAPVEQKAISDRSQRTLDERTKFEEETRRYKKKV